MLDSFGPLEMFSVANRLLVRQGEKPLFEVTSEAWQTVWKVGYYVFFFFFVCVFFCCRFFF